MAPIPRLRDYAGPRSFHEMLYGYLPAVVTVS